MAGLVLPERMMTTREVAEALHLHVNTVNRLGDRGELVFYRVCERGDRRYRPEEVSAFLERMTKGGRR
jgi:excisionase family DNA binding protein